MPVAAYSFSLGFSAAAAPSCLARADERPGAGSLESLDVYGRTGRTRSLKKTADALGL